MARDVPRHGTCLARERFLSCGLVLASHANAFTFTRRVVKLVEPFGLLSVRLDFGEYYVS